MNPITMDEVQQIVGKSDESTHCSDFNSERFTEFLDIWMQRADEALNYHKRSDLVRQAEQVIAFAQASGHEFLRLYACASEKTGRVGFLYNIHTREFLQVGDRKSTSEQGGHGDSTGQY